MTDPVFQKAYEAVRTSHSEEEWGALTPRQITDAIYREIRRLDAHSHESGMSSAPARGTITC